MSVSKVGTMEIPEALAQEARKYKSADEFIESLKQKTNEEKKKIIEMLETMNNEKYTNFSKSSKIKKLYH